MSEPVRIELPEPRERRARTESRWLWLLPLLLLACAALVGGFLIQGPLWLFGWVLSALFALIGGWIAVSIFWPARANRRCPACGQLGLVRADPNSTHGLRCTLCAWSDEVESGWLLAEEEGPLESIVLAERAELRALVKPEPMGDSRP